VSEWELTGLPIPAHAEIALEGFISAEEVEIPEGPYGEWQGYYQEGWPRNPVIQIDRVYHRDDPIILGCPQGKPPHEDNRFLAYLRSGLIWDQLEKAGVPNVVNVWSPPEGGNRLMTVVAIEQAYPGHAKQTAHIAAQCAAAVELNRITVVVDHHVDATSLQDVMWAILTRCDPARDVDIIARTKGMRIDVAVSHEDREARLNSRMIIDATAPFELADQRGGGAPVGSPQRSRATREKWGWVLNRTVDSG